MFSNWESVSIHTIPGHSCIIRTRKQENEVKWCEVSKKEALKVYLPLPLIDFVVVPINLPSPRRISPPHNTIHRPNNSIRRKPNSRATPHILNNQTTPRIQTPTIPIVVAVSIAVAPFTQTLQAWFVTLTANPYIVFLPFLPLQIIFLLQPLPLPLRRWPYHRRHRHLLRGPSGAS